MQETVDVKLTKDEVSLGLWLFSTYGGTIEYRKFLHTLTGTNLETKLELAQMELDARANQNKT